MLKVFNKIPRLVRENGLVGFLCMSIRHVYKNSVRPHLPKSTVKYSGIEVPAGCALDRFIPGMDFGDRPLYEGALVELHQEYTTRDDDVVIVGGGWGVTAVVAAKEAGENGKVTIFEGAKNQLDNIVETSEFHDVYDRIDIRHAIVGPKISLRGSAKSEVAHVDPEDLPACDVLELDCEGSEIEILERLDIRPRIIFVESHGHLGAPSDLIQDKLESMSYRVISKDPAAGQLTEFDAENDVFILTASLAEGDGQS
jgi:hypothetical protein